MKRRSVLFLLGLGCWLLSAPAYAAITVEPDALVISTTENRGVTRTLNLSSDVDVRRLAIATSDLERTDNRAVLPARAIQLQQPPTSLQAGELVQVPITLEPSEARVSGEFTGVVWVTYDGTRQTIPITLRTKDPIGLPLLVLLAGVALGSTLAWYRTRGLPQDELVVRMGQLRTQMRTDAELETVGQRFRQRIEGDLMDVESMLGVRNWEAATTHLELAESTWKRWRKGREDWLRQIQYLQMLQQQVKQSAMVQTDYGNQVQAGLEDIERRMAEFDTPQVLRETLIPLRDGINRFQSGETLMMHMAQLETRIKDEERRRYWAAERDLLEAGLNELNPQNPDAYEQWKNSFKEKQQAMQQDLYGQENAELRGGELEVVARGDLARMQSLGLPLVPGVGSYSGEGAARSARSRLRIFRLVSQGVAIAFLSWAGLNELYEGNPIFGASPVGDYLALAAWGFGAEVTRDSIVKAVQELNGSAKSRDQMPMT
ncbi:MULTISPECIES: hypothetical protein [unclassified Leptolyngbya]|uniref:hypothetical protein n=1 Tax=unclassified Leptolyngbya TaxID=2650499 RepID=UPI0016844354|nr:MULTISPECIES: hypothetical protein [unclassified Leptolyngbya]MBD1913874.1 hypothetical protein [Leptolyngbya sp. FACHB-8]MBD2157384.1 hypothetical protein [Leptolyngbya sp. FACHB-16]